MSLQRIVRGLLIVLSAFLAVTAIGGGLGLITGAIAPGPALLRGSPFTGYMIPGLALLCIVGGSALAATVLLWRRQPLGVALAGLAGAMIFVFEVVEVSAIGSDPGVARNLQLFYFTVGTLLVLLAAAQWAMTRRKAVPS